MAKWIISIWLLALLVAGCGEFKNWTVFPKAPYPKAPYSYYDDGEADKTCEHYIYYNHYYPLGREGGKP